jgi:ketosteroid isomerase-like protein
VGEDLGLGEQVLTTGRLVDPRRSTNRRTALPRPHAGHHDRRMSSAELSRAFFDAFCRHDLDTMMSMMVEDVRYELVNAPTLTSRDAVRDMYTSLFEALGDAEITLLEFIAQGNQAALILSLPGSDEPGGSVFHEWSDDGLLLRYQSFSRV